MSRQPLPAWLKVRLETQGLMDRDTGATRKARAMYCPRCNAHIFRGLDADWGSMSRDVDPMPLSQLGEVMALLARRRTFSLRWLSNHFVIDTRDHFGIRKEPAATIPGLDVVVQHDCERVGGLDSALPVGQLTRLRPVRTVNLPEDPPF